MEDQHDHVSTPLSEDWFDMIIPFISELELPNVSNPMNPSPWLNDDASFIPKLDTVLSPVHASAYVMQGSFGVDPQIHTSSTSANDSSTSNDPPMTDQQTLVPGSTETPSFVSDDSTPWLGSNGPFPMRSHMEDPACTNTSCFNSASTLPAREQQVGVLNPTNKSSFLCSNNSTLQRNQQNHALPSSGSNYPSNAPRYDFNNPLNNQQSNVNPILPHTSLSGSDGSFSMRNQQNHVLEPSNFFGSDDSLPMRHQLTHITSSENAYWYDSSGSHSIQGNLSSHVPCSTFTSSLDSNSSIPLCKHHGLAPTLNDSSHLSHGGSLLMGYSSQSSSSIENQHPPSQIPATESWPDYSRIHVCPICDKIFPSSNALGGHMSAHARARKREAMLAGWPYKSNNKITFVHSSIGSMVTSGSAHGLDYSPMNLSTTTNYFLQLPQENLKVPLIETRNSSYKAPPSEIGKEESSSSYKVAKKMKGFSLHGEINENEFTQVKNVSQKEGSLDITAQLEHQP
uniref:C2H2-type domain-containing protein n=1 Tax=Nelumbo nucifera TaxID=4432 RepID=A0A822YGA8_NELNU|nr:TPA_asm: hypothetical protein HUJ06_031483 [Nelumbo nucifera]